MPRFIAWNNLLLAEYFSPASDDEEVWLQTNRSELDSLGLHIGGADGLINAVKEGPGWLDMIEEDCAHIAAHLARQRKSTPRSSSYVDPGSMDIAYAGTNAPTYLPILALWVLASSESDEAGFYAKVSELLQAGFQSSPKLTKAMSIAWEDLEYWSTAECKGRFGNFRRRVLGKHRFVGVPRSQCLVTSKDLRSLHGLFSRLALGPGQRLTQEQFRHAAQEGSNAYYLSHGLQRAFTSEAYRKPLQKILEQALFEWDGTRPSQRIDTDKSSDEGLSEEKPIDYTTVGLALTDSDAWSIQFRFHASGLGKRCVVEFDKGICVSAALEVWSGTFCTHCNNLLQRDMRMILARSDTQDIEHQIQYEDEETGSSEGDFRSGKIEQRYVRTLTWDTPDPQHGEMLVERPMPVHGPVYILCSPRYRKKLKRNLKRERIEYEKVNLAGLPDGWTLTCVENIERLTHEQRELISNSEQSDLQPRIRFVGGRVLMRGWSRRFAWYDLPFLEVEALPNARVIAEGIELEPLAGEDSKARSPVRRYRISISEKSRHVFKFQITIDDQEIASAKLRVVPSVGIGTASPGVYSLDRLGRPRQDKDGLRGARIEVIANGDSLVIESEPAIIHGLPDQSAIPIQDSASAKLLDSLAWLGSMGYGPARDQLQRLGSPDAEPTFVILDLWRRGYLEVEIDDRGHMNRLHATPPTIYSLPALHRGMILHGICGTPRSQHWLKLAQHGDYITSVDYSNPDRLPIMRLAIEGASVRKTVRDLDFHFEQLPCHLVSRWASSIDIARDKLASWGRSQFLGELEQLQRLHPAYARFKPVVSEKMEIEPMVKSQLFRFDDPKIPGLRVYMLGTINPDGQESFSFIRDSRWGVWISLVAFARMLHEEHGRDDVDPWPIPYDGNSRELWLPASLRPPVVLERGLVLCSGASPRAIRMMKPPGEQEGGRLPLIKEQSGVIMGWAGSAYADFIPGTWLCYQWVPRAIAIRIAKRLGGVTVNSSNPSASHA